MNFITIKYLNNNFFRLLLYFKSIYLFIADKHRCTQGGEEGGEGGTSCTRYKDFEKLPHKNAIETTPLTDFLTTPSTPLKRIYQKPEGPPPWISNDCASMLTKAPRILTKTKGSLKLRNIHVRTFLKANLLEKHKTDFILEWMGYSCCV